MSLIKSKFDMDSIDIYFMRIMLKSILIHVQINQTMKQEMVSLFFLFIQCLKIEVNRKKLAF